MSFAEPAFWIGFLQIIGIDLMLSGDNAVVIALACRNAPPTQQRLAMGLGGAAAAALRAALALVVFGILELPYVKLAGGLLLLWVAFQLGRSRPRGIDGQPTAHLSLWTILGQILLADAVMSLDNVVAIAGAARGSLVLLVLGLAVSVPLVVSGSRLMLGLMGRLPVLVSLGAGLVGWVAGDMIAAEPSLRPWIETSFPVLSYGLPLAGIVFGLGSGWFPSRRATSPRA